ncbi:hypothetical protein SAVIM338S_04594 [Streptomyces avidinii]
MRASAARGEAGLIQEECAATRWHRIDGGAGSGALAAARAAAFLPVCAEEYNPLFTAVLPDEDGVVRARWQL